MANNLYEEAINAAEQLKEAAESKVKQHLIEAMSPQIKQLVEKSLLGKESVLQTTINKKGVDMKGKFGRVLGDFIVDKKKVSKLLCEAGHAVPYFGGSKKDVEAKHMKNRHKLVDAGIVEGPLE